MPSDKPIFSLRIDEELLDKIRFLADLNSRSLNKEIEFALKQYVKDNEDMFREVG